MVINILGLSWFHWFGLISIGLVVYIKVFLAALHPE